MKTRPQGIAIPLIGVVPSKVPVIRLPRLGTELRKSLALRRGRRKVEFCHTNDSPPWVPRSCYLCRFRKGTNR